MAHTRCGGGRRFGRERAPPAPAASARRGLCGSRFAVLSPRKRHAAPERRTRPLIAAKGGLTCSRRGAKAELSCARWRLVCGSLDVSARAPSMGLSEGAPRSIGPGSGGKGLARMGAFEEKKGGGKLGTLGGTRGRRSRLLLPCLAPPLLLPLPLFSPRPLCAPPRLLPFSFPFFLSPHPVFPKETRARCVHN